MGEGIAPATEKCARAPVARASEAASVVKILDAHYWEPARVARDPDDPLFDAEQRWLYDEVLEDRRGMFVSEGIWSAGYAADEDEGSASARPSSSLHPAQHSEQAYDDMPRMESTKSGRARPRKMLLASFIHAKQLCLSGCCGEASRPRCAKHLSGSLSVLIGKSNNRSGHVMAAAEKSRR